MGKKLCPLCKKELTKVPDEEGYHCKPCDASGLTGVYKRGKTIVGRP